MYKHAFLSARRILIYIFLALAALGLGQVLGLLCTSQEPQSTLAASAPTLVTGTVIRQEQVIYAPEPGLWQSVLESGQKASKGQTLFILEESRSTVHLAQRLKQVQLGLSYAAQPLPARRDAIHEAIAALGSGSGDSSTLVSLLLSEGDTSAESAALEEELENISVTTSAHIEAPEGGIFVPVVDGLETVLTPETPVLTQALLPLTPVSDLALGRLVTGDSWYLSVLLPVSAAVGDRIQAELLSGIFRSCTLTVLETDASGWALLSCQELLAEVAPLRQLTMRFL
jgi:hypothetical protein